MKYTLPLVMTALLSACGGRGGGGGSHGGDSGAPSAPPTVAPPVSINGKVFSRRDPSGADTSYYRFTAPDKFELHYVTSESESGKKRSVVSRGTYFESKGEFFTAAKESSCAQYTMVMQYGLKLTQDSETSAGLTTSKLGSEIAFPQIVAEQWPEETMLTVGCFVQGAGFEVRPVQPLE